MCGIAGIVRSGQSSLELPEMTTFVETMIATIAHRGPDASGVWSDPAGRCVLGHRRLSIIDTSPAGRQPMATGDGRWLITFNGELYNFQEVRPALEAAGVRLRGRTDTEVLIESIALWGTEAFARFDGMFAFAAFDTLSGELLLARDPFGEKPLYYMELPGGDLAFGSELQALERLPGFDGTVDIDAVAEVLSFQYVGAPRSIYRSVKKLPPGHWLRRDGAGRIQIGRYYQFRPGLSGVSDRPISDLADELEDILTRSIRRRLIADVPLGAFLSGGVDSSTVCALVRRKLGLPIMTFSTGFGGAPESEHLTARAFAEHLGTNHHEEILTPDAADFLLHIGELLDEPNGDSSCLPTYLLSRFARRHVTVAVSGDGGDEMFGGYGRYFATLDELALHRRGELPYWTPGRVYFGNRILITIEKHLADLFGFVPAGFASHVGQMRTELDAAQDRLLCEMRRTDVDNYMPGAVLSKVDRMSMRHSLEVRTPYLSTELARFAERLPDSVLVQDGRGKRVLREVAYRYLPRHLIDLPKQGFGLPMSDWARTSLLDVAAKLVESEDSRLHAMFGTKGIERFMRRQRMPGQFSAYQVWCVAMLESWLRHHPASLPAISESQARGRGQKGLVATSVGKDTYLLFEHPGDAATQDELEPVFEFLSAVLPNEIRTVETIADLTTLRFPEWGEPIGDDDAHKLTRLRGSTLLCLEKETALNIDFEECSKLQRLGIARLIFPHPYQHEHYGGIEIRRVTRMTRWRSIFKLMRHVVGVISNRFWGKLFRTIRFSIPKPGLNVSAPIARLNAAPDADMSSSFMLFEGARQLPPIQVSHEDIQTKGRGRYSVWNQQVHFSPTEPKRLYRWPYWLVPLNDDTKPFLQLLPEAVWPKADTNPVSSSRVEKLVASSETSAFVLHPGDPVAVCTHSLSPGGAERQWVYLAQALANAGYDVSVVVYHPLLGERGHYLPVLEKSGIRVIAASDVSVIDQIQVCARMPGASALLTSNLVPERGKVMRLAAAFAKISPKVVFTQLDEPNIVAGFAAHLAGVPRIVASFRNYNPTNFPYINKDWYLAAYRLLSKSNRVLFSGNHRDANLDYAKWIGIAPERVTCIPNVIEPEMFPTPTNEQLTRVRVELELQADTPILLGAFRFSAEKDPLAFIEVCARVVKHVPNLRVLLVGVGPMQPLMEKRIAERALNRHVSFLGRRSDMNVLLTLASVFLLTSLKEGMPNVLMEAQFMGTPVVATRAGGTPDTVIDGETASLRAVGDIDGLAAACVSLLRESGLAQRMGTAGQQHAMSAFSEALLVERYLDLIQGDPTPRTRQPSSVQERVNRVAAAAG